MARVKQEHADAGFVIVNADDDSDEKQEYQYERKRKKREDMKMIQGIYI